jgi:hypothetical protein
LFSFSRRLVNVPGELFALHRDDLDLERGIVDVRHSLCDDRRRLSIVDAKADSARIPIERETVKVLKRHLAAMDAEGHGSRYVFVTPSGCWLRDGPVNRTILRPILERARLGGTTLYGPRRTGVSQFAGAGYICGLPPTSLGIAVWRSPLTCTLAQARLSTGPAASARQVSSGPPRRAESPNRGLSGFPAIGCTCGGTGSGT